jgi:hypothetical protein
LEKLWRQTGGMGRGGRTEGARDRLPPHVFVRQASLRPPDAP